MVRHVSGLSGEGSRRSLAVAAEKHAGAHRRGEPFMRVTSDGIGPLDARERKAQTIREGGGAAPRGIHVVPEPMRGREFGELRQRVNYSRVSRPRCADDQEWQ